MLINVVEKNYIKAQKYRTMKRKLAFYWLIVFVTMTSPILSHVKDKNDMFTDFLLKGKIPAFHHYLYH